MYQILGDEVYDSQDIAKKIEQYTSFTVREDMSKRTKRDDALAFKLSIPVKILDPTAKDYIEDDTEINQLMVLADEMSNSQMENLGLKFAIQKSYAYKYDEVKNEILLVSGIMHISNGRRKLPDVMKRLLSQV